MYKFLERGDLRRGTEYWYHSWQIPEFLFHGSFSRVKKFSYNLSNLLTFDVTNILLSSVIKTFISTLILYFSVGTEHSIGPYLSSFFNFVY